MERSELWRHTHAERRVLACHLSQLSAEQWAGETLCEGWTVHDVAAHVISNPQLGWGSMPGMLARNVGRGYNAMVFREVKRLGARVTRDQVLRDFQTYDGSTRHVPVTTRVEPLVDAILHAQDIYRPLGIEHSPAPEASALAADRCLLLGSMMGWRKGVAGRRLVATDTDWSHGRAQPRGTTVEAPMLELLLLCSGRSSAARV